MSFIFGLGRSAGEENGNPFQYSCQENPMERGAWQATVHGVRKSTKRLRDWTAAIETQLISICEFYIMQLFWFYCLYQFFGWVVGFSLVVFVHSLSCVQLFGYNFRAHQASPSFTVSEFTQTLVHWVSDGNQPSHPLLLPSIFPLTGSFPKSRLFTSGGQSTGASALASSFQWTIRVDFL